MYRLALALTVVGVLFVAEDAHAQFANRSITFSIGYLNLDTEAQVDWGVPLGLGTSGYIENGFEWTMNVGGMLLTEPIVGRQFIGVNGGIGMRYLFLEEQLRPYLGAGLSYLHFFRDEGVSNYFGIGPNLGVDYFVGETFSIGLNGQFNVYWFLNQPVTTSRGLSLVLGAWF